MIQPINAPRVSVEYAEEADPGRTADFFRKWIAILREEEEKDTRDAEAAA